MKKQLISLFFLCVASTIPAQAGLKIFYIRHAEGGHNVKQEWEEKKIPKAEWPAYVGDGDMFTPLGEKQVVLATEKLRNYRFDFIATSPLWRAKNTIRPYLAVTEQKAEVWPELKEGTGMTMILADDLPRVKGKILNEGDSIHIHKHERPYFERREGAKREYEKYPKGSDERIKTAYMKHVTLHAIERIEKDFGDSDKSILLVGHNSAGVSLLKLLLGEAPGGKAARGIQNTGIWMVEKNDNGQYELKIYNSEPFHAH